MAVDLGDLLLDGQARAVEVDVFPPQADRLAAAHPGEEDQVVEVGQPVIGDVTKEGLALLHRPRLGSLRVLRCELDVLGRAVGDEAGA